MTRSEFLRLTVGSAAAVLSPTRRPRPKSPAPRETSGGTRFAAVMFDGFPIFDPRGVSRVAEEIFPGRGADLVRTWRTRQFEYQWLRALGGRYTDFREATSDALTFAAGEQRLELTATFRERLMNVYLALPVWPDVEPCLIALKESGLRLSILSNMTPDMLRNGLREAGLTAVFEHVLSTDALRTYKPDPRAYAMGADALGVPRERILFAAFAGWDAAGAKWFGYPTFWVNRLDQPREILGLPPDASGHGLADLVAYVRRMSS